MIAQWHWRKELSTSLFGWKFIHRILDKLHIFYRGIAVLLMEKYEKKYRFILNIGLNIITL